LYTGFFFTLKSFSTLQFSSFQHIHSSALASISMLFASLLSLSALTCVIAADPVQTRRNVVAFNITQILNVLDRISTGMTKVDAEVKLWLGDLENGLRILDDGNWVHQDMSTGASFIERLPNEAMTTRDSMKIAAPMSKMMQTADSYTKGLLKNKPAIYKNRLESQFLLSLQNSKLAAQALSKAIKTKQPITMAWSVEPTTDVFIKQFEKTAKDLSTPPPSQPWANGGSNQQSPPRSGWGFRF
jgi:hypothetical protein